MDRQHPQSEIVPDSLDDELRTALNGEPSALFVSRVRARVASESMERPWWHMRTLAPAAIVLIAMVTAWVAFERADRPVAVAARPLLARPVVPPAAIPVTPPGATARVALPPRESPARLAPGRATGAQPVGDDSAARAWLASVDTGRVRVVIVDHGEVSTRVASLATALHVPPLDIAPVTVAPISPFAE